MCYWPLARGRTVCVTGHWLGVGLCVSLARGRTVCVTGHWLEVGLCVLLATG